MIEAHLPGAADTPDDNKPLEDFTLAEAIGYRDEISRLLTELNDTMPIVLLGGDVEDIQKGLGMVLQGTFLLANLHMHIQRLETLERAKN